MVKTRRRHSPLSPGSFQSRFLTVSILHYFAIALTFVAVMFFPLMLQLDDPALPLDKRLVFANQFLSLHQRLWPALLVVLVLLIIHLVHFSHHFAGPLYRCRQAFRQVAEGDLSVATTIRKGDYLHEEVRALNDMVSALRATVDEVDDQVSQTRGTYAELEKALPDRPGSDIAQRMRALDEQLASLEKSLRWFRTARPTDQPELGS